MGTATNAVTADVQNWWQRTRQRKQSLADRLKSKRGHLAAPVGSHDSLTPSQGVTPDSPPLAHLLSSDTANTTGSAVLTLNLIATLNCRLIQLRLSVLPTLKNTSDLP